jgi:hypothetical protein
MIDAPKVDRGVIAQNITDQCRKGDGTGYGNGNAAL